MEIVTFGNSALKIAEQIKALGSSYEICSYGETEGFTHRVKKAKTPKEYSEQKNVPLPNIEGEEVLVIMSGASNIAGLALGVISSFQEKKITVLFNKTNYDTNDICKHHYLVLCQYARSGAFDRIVSFRNDLVQVISGEGADFFDLYGGINNAIAYCTHMLNVTDNMTPIVSEKGKKFLTTTIQTFGLFSLEGLTGVPFDDLKDVKEVEYFLFLKEAKGEVAIQIRELQQKLKKDTEGGIASSMSLFKATMNEFCFFLEKTNNPKQ